MGGGGTLPGHDEARIWDRRLGYETGGWDLDLEAGEGGYAEEENGGKIFHYVKA